MGNLFTYPSEDEIRQKLIKVPDYAQPNGNPHAIIWEGALTNQHCDDIITICMTYEPHKFHSCDATTRECPMPLSAVFYPISNFALSMNALWWKFDLDKSPGAYMQTYKEKEGYPLHTDSEVGLSRKLTVVINLTDPDEYTEGQLYLLPLPDSFAVPKERGTLVVFPSWILHKVTPVESGMRQSINMAFWGPPFK